MKILPFISLICLYSIINAMPLENNADLKIDDPASSSIVDPPAAPEGAPEFHILPYIPAKNQVPSNDASDGSESNNKPNQWWVQDAVQTGSGASRKGHRRGNLKQHIQKHRSAIKEHLLHALKVLIPQNAADSWCRLTAADRQCIQNAQTSLGILWLAGASNVNDEDSWLRELKKSCPNAAEEIDAWQANATEQRTQAQDQWNKNFNELPASVQDVMNTFNSSFNTLRLNHQLFPANNDAIKQAALQVVQKFLDVPQADWDKVVATYPNTSVILSSNGELHGNFTVLVNALKEYLQTGTVADQTAVQTAKDAFKNYGIAQWNKHRDSFGNYTQAFEAAPENNICPEVLSEIETNIDSKLPVLEEHAPIAEAHVLPVDEDYV